MSGYVVTRLVILVIVTSVAFGKVKRQNRAWDFGKLMSYARTSLSSLHEAEGAQIDTILLFHCGP